PRNGRLRWPTTACRPRSVRLAEVEQETAEAVRAGWLDDTAPDADPARAALAASDAEKTTVAAWDAACEAARTAADRAREAAATETRAELTAARAEDAASAAESAYEAEHRAAESIAADDRLAQLLSLPPTQTPLPSQRATGSTGPAASAYGADAEPGASGAAGPAGVDGSVPGARGADGAAAGPAHPAGSAQGLAADSHAAEDAAPPAGTAGSVPGVGALPVGSAGPGAFGTAGTATRTADSVPAPVHPLDGPLTVDEFDRYADELRRLLDQSIASAERNLFDLRTAAADDARILGALGDGGLLPPGPDVLATVEYLGEHGIPALPGWRYLAQAVDPADHARVLAARPELVDGVVITDPVSYARAREVLGGAALLPRSTVAVGTAAALLAPVPSAEAGDGETDVFLVPPNPAMHDEHAADEERQALRARAASRDEEIRTLAADLRISRSAPAAPPPGPEPAACFRAA
ncbi:hypothetical protein AB0C77_38710, partial [Streptomyces sp. NPDC048629]